MSESESDKKFIQQLLDCKSELHYLIGYMDSLLKSMRDHVLEEQYSKLFHSVDNATKMLKEKYGTILNKSESEKSD